MCRKHGDFFQIFFLFLDNFCILKKEYWFRRLFFEIKIHHKKTNIAQNGHSAFEKEQKLSMKTTKHTHTHTQSIDGTNWTSS
jgi:hypothetical protein